MNTSDKTCDVLIAGGGLTGGALALALRECGLRVVLLDARRDDAPLTDARVLALGVAARDVLEKLGVWSRLPVAGETPAAQTVTEVRICQQKGGGLTRLLAQDLRAEALGYMVSMPALQTAMDAALREQLVSSEVNDGATGVDSLTRYFGARLQSAVTDDTGVTATLQDGTLWRASLLVIADGQGAALPAMEKNSTEKTERAEVAAARVKHDYGQQALLARLHCGPVSQRAAVDKRHASPTAIAYEYFTEYGPLALLPYRDTAGVSYHLVWTMDAAQAACFMALTEAAFCAQLNRVLGRVCRETGIVLQTTGRQAVPLQLDYASKVAGARTVMLGNAAQKLHPVGAQGFNLALRDVQALAHTVCACSEGLGAQSFLDHYVNQRQRDRAFAIGFTHQMACAGGRDTMIARLPHAAALKALDLVAPLRRRAAQALIYGRR